MGYFYAVDDDRIGSDRLFEFLDSPICEAEQNEYGEITMKINLCRIYDPDNWSEYDAEPIVVRNDGSKFDFNYFNEFESQGIRLIRLGWFSNWQQAYECYQNIYCD